MTKMYALLKERAMSLTIDKVPNWLLEESDGARPLTNATPTDNPVPHRLVDKGRAFVRQVNTHKRRVLTVLRAAQGEVFSRRVEVSDILENGGGDTPEARFEIVSLCLCIFHEQLVMSACTSSF